MALKIKAHQCQSCEKQLLILSGYCPQCRSKNSFMPIEVEGVGEILSYTIIHVSEERFGGDTPYPVAIVELDGGLRVLGRLTKDDPASLQIGIKVGLAEYKEEAPVFKRIG